MARATSTRRAGGGTIQSLHDSDLAAEEYVKRKAWWDATAPPCPYHPNGGCKLLPHGTYVRKCPKGMRVRRFLCKGTGRTVSALPSCMLASWTGTVRKLERDANVAARASTHSAVRRAVLAHGHSADDRAATKLVYLALMRVQDKWTGKPRSWRQALNEFAIH